jgi:equilibrative nucleoside transporter 1/2/3
METQSHQQPLLDNENEDSEDISGSSSSEENLSINNEILSDSYIAHSFRRKSNPARPRDNYFFVYIVFYLLGMTTLLPWNFFITAEEVSFL